MVAGTMIAVWMGELITEQGVGNGVSIIIFGGIVAEMPSQVAGFVSRGDWVNLILFSLITVATIAVIAFVQEGSAVFRYSTVKRVRGTGFMVDKAHIPLKVNSAGMIPLDFCSVDYDFPQCCGGFVSVQ
jgi:preprotein translocase subunit SecY